jgi:hypothetical protein
VRKMSERRARALCASAMAERSCGTNIVGWQSSYWGY